MGGRGPNSCMFAYFKMLMTTGLNALRKYIDEISVLLEITM